MTYREAYEWGRKTLEEAQVADADVDARLLLEYVCHTDRNALLVHGDRAVEELSFFCYKKYIEKRAERIPLQQLLHEQEFMGLSFYVNEHVLIPRQDTEILVEEVMREPYDGARILDLCTGSGCILLSILKYVYGSSGVGVDISDGALRVAGANSEALGIDATFIKSDMFESIPRDERFDIIVSNPPYIKSNVIETLMSEVKDYEPMSALDGSADGLRFYRIIADRAPEFLNKGGMLFVEIGYDQGEEVSALITEAGFTDVQVIKDLSGLDRVVSGRIGLI